MKFSSCNSVSPGLFPLALTFSLALAWMANAETARANKKGNSEANYELNILSSSLYTDAQGRQVIDAIQGYDTDLAITVYDQDGQPVVGLEPDFVFEGKSSLVPFYLSGRDEYSSTTDETGLLPFSFRAGEKGMDRLDISVGDSVATLYVNVLGLEINDFPAAPTLSEGLNWYELMRARVDFVDGEMTVDFPEEVQFQDGETVKVSGFIMPLDPGLKQTHFLLTSSPPNCFFHIPGGPAGVIEVFSEDGIEATWDPVVIEGEFELVKASTTGVIYQLKQADVVDAD